MRDTHGIANAGSPLAPTHQFVPGPVLLLGAPGVGKGTQAQLLMEAFGIPQISTGDLLRQQVNDGTKLGRLAKTLMDEGQLVPDELVTEMVAARLQEPDTTSGYILDGFPRTERQASWLDVALPALNQPQPLVALQITLDTQDLLQRITGRRTCLRCRRIYNVFSHPPRSEGHCDFDQTTLIHRSDDTEAAFTARLQEYNLKTGPVIEHYRRHGRFREVDGSGPVADVAYCVMNVIREFRA